MRWHVVVFYVVVLYVHGNDLHKEDELFTCICKLIYTPSYVDILSCCWEFSLQDGERTLDVFFFIVTFVTGSISAVTTCKT